MKYLEPIVASICFSLLLLAGILALESSKDVFGPSAGAAVALAAIAAFLVVYDIMKRQDATPGAGRGKAEDSAGIVAPRVPLSDIETVDAVARDKDAIAAIDAATKGFDRHTPVALRIALPAPDGPAGTYERDHLLLQIKTLHENFKDHRYVYFVKPSQRFLGFAPSAKLIALLQGSRAVIELINHGRFEELLSEDGIEGAKVFSNATNKDALKQLARLDKPLAMVVNPRNERALGLIDWATLVARVLGTSTS